MESHIRSALRHNMRVNILEGGFYGMAIGFASFVTVLPLFVSSMTDSAILIGLIPAIHVMGWQLPQILIARQVSRQSRYKTMVMKTTIHERLPFLVLAVIAWAIPRLGEGAALTLTFTMLIWQGLGSGFAAISWQSMIAKIIPSERRGTFFGLQFATANFLSSLSAILAGYILEAVRAPINYTLCFLLASVAMVLSWIFISRTQEPKSESDLPEIDRVSFWKGLHAILRMDVKFRWFVLARMITQFAIMGFSFYTVYVVRHLGVSKFETGLMTGVYLGIQIVANPVMGWLGDRIGHRIVMEAGLLAAIGSALLAWWAPEPGWFYLVFILTGIASVAVWTTGISMVLEFGEAEQRPFYIGLANSLIAPATILAPFIGGWLADLAGYPATFLASAAGGVLTVLVLRLLMAQTPKLAA